MSVTLWIDTDREETIELGPTIPAYAAFAEMARAAGADWRDEYADLAGVLTQCENQDDADPAWLADVRAQASKFHHRFHGRLSAQSLHLLATLVSHIDHAHSPERLGESTDAQGHEHAADGRFSSTGGGSASAKSGSSPGGEKGGGKSPKKLTTPGEAEGWGEDHFRGTIDSLSGRERKALQDYGQDTFIGINRALRAGHKGSWGAEIKALDSAMKKSRVPEDVVVYRGISAHVLDGIEAGDIFRDRGFSCTSLRPDTARLFRDEAGGGGATLTIKVPAGSQGIYLDALRGDHDQAELLLPRNSRMKIVRKKGRHYVAVLIPRRDQDKLGESKDAQGHEHAADGKFGSGGSKADKADAPASKLSAIAAFAKKAPAALVAKVKAAVQKKYAALESRYGPKYAKAIIAAGIAGVPIPVPGSSLLAAAPVLALAELHRMASGGPKAVSESEAPEMSEEEIDEAAAELLRELYEAFGVKQVKESTDAQGHEHAADGKFGKGGGQPKHPPKDAHASRQALRDQRRSSVEQRQRHAATLREVPMTAATEDHAAEFAAVGERTVEAAKLAGAEKRHLDKLQAILDRAGPHFERAAAKAKKAAKAMEAAKAAADALAARGAEPEKPDTDAMLEEVEHLDADDPAYLKVEAEAEALTEKWEKAHDKWQAVFERAEELRDRADELAGEAEEAAEEAFDTHAEKLDDASQKVADELEAALGDEEDALDAEDEADPEPDDPEEETDEEDH